MIIITDTREQKPLTFVHPFVTEVITTKLDFGDYSCRYSDGYQPPIYFERKSLGDLFGTMGAGYERFKRELMRSKVANSLLILLVEASFTDVLRGYSHSTIKGISIVRKLFTLLWKYNMHFHFFNDRDEMSRFILEYYFAIGRSKCRQPN